MKKILEVKNLKKSFGENLILDDINFSLKKGEKTALIGSDGAGKTTLLRLIAGLLIPDNKEENPILIDKLSPFYDLSKTKKLIGYMPQKFGLYEDLTVEENLEFYFGIKNIEKSKKEELFQKMLDFSGLYEFKKRLSGNLSGGMKQKLALACILLSSPRLLLLDEPSVGVDPKSRKDLIEITDNLSKNQNQSIIWATGYLDEAKYFDKVLLIKEGKSIYFGTPKGALDKMRGRVFYLKPKKEDLRKFLENIQKNEKSITDSLIEGDKIRATFKTIEDAKNFNFEKEETEPLFEDFVMSEIKDNRIKILQIKNDVVCLKTPFAIEVRNLRKKFKNFTAVDSVNFNVNQGEIYGLLGPNGAGKSTIFKMLIGLLSSDSGYSRIMGVDISKNPIEAKENFGYMAQKFSLFSNLTVFENVEFFKKIYGAKVNIDEVLASYDLLKYKNTKTNFLSLGYKQRLALLCSIIHNPCVLFLDEPTSGVDPISRREFWLRINNLVEHKTTVLVTTHFMDEAQFCDRVALIYRGKILKEDTPENFIKSVENKQNPTMEEAFIEIIGKADKK